MATLVGLVCGRSVGSALENGALALSRVPIRLSLLVLTALSIHEAAPS